MSDFEKMFALKKTFWFILLRENDMFYIFGAFSKA